MREPLLLPAVAFAAGIAAARHLGLSAPEIGPGLALLMALTILALRIGLLRVAASACLLALALAGALRMAVRYEPSAPELDAAPGELLLFSGCIVEPPDLSQDRQQFLLELEPGARARVSLYLKDGEAAPDLAYGQRVELEGRARPVRNFQNPGSFDYAAYLARRDVYWNVTAVRSTIRVLPGACGDRFRRAIYSLRTHWVRRLEQLYPESPYTSAMMQAVVVGSAAGLEKTWVEDWRRTGTYHAIVISGLQITVLAAVFLFLFRLCLVPEIAALAVTAGAAWLYALVAGADAPVLRAAAGFNLFVIARWLHRRLRLLNVLAAVALIFLLADPTELFEASFQLSVLAVAAIGALAVPALEATSAPLVLGLSGLSDRARDPSLPARTAHFRVELRLLAETVHLWTGLSERRALALLAVPLRVAFFLFELLVVSLSVQIGLALPMALYFHRLSLTGLSANLLIGPLMSAVVPLGFLALATGWSIPAAIAGRLVDLARSVVEFHVAWEPNWRIPDPPPWLGVAVTTTLLAVALTARRGKRLWMVPASALTALLTVLVVHPFTPDLRPGCLELAVIDVGQGESLLLALPDGRLMLVDGGGFPAIGRRRPRLDIGEDVVSPYLWRRGIKRLDVVAATHGHEDHIGGLAAIIENFRPRQFWFAVMPETPTWRALRDRASSLGVELVPVRAGRSFRFGEARIEVLAPEADYEAHATPRNDDSLVVGISFGRHRFLLTGDIERRAEEALLARRPPGRRDVLKVAHHGGRSSTAEAFLDEVRPALALISAGFANPYHLPHPALLERLARRRILTLRTDTHGLIRVLSDGRYLELGTRRWSQ